MRNKLSTLAVVGLTLPFVWACSEGSSGGGGVSSAGSTAPAIAPVAAPIAAVMDRGARLLRRSTPPPLTNSMVAFLGRDRMHDISAARNAIGYQPRTSLHAGLQEMRTLAGRSHADAA